MHPLNRKLLRDLWHIRGQALAIAVVIGCGIAMFVMTTGVVASLEATRDAYYDRYRFADIFAEVKRAPLDVAARVARLEGVRAIDTRIVKTVTLDVPGLLEPAIGRLVSLPDENGPSLNAISLRQGRLIEPGRTSEVILSEAFAEANDLVPGDSLQAIINGSIRRLTVVGIALSPEYVYTIAPGALMPDNRRFGILWMAEEALAAAFDLEGGFNDITVLLSRGIRPQDVIARIDRMLEPYGGLGAYTREDQISNWFLNGEIEQLDTMATILPTVFLLVAALLLNMATARLISTEREQIGLLKAFGYTDLDVGWHYMKLVLALAFFGMLLGLALGAWLGRGMTEMYTQFYRFPFLFYRPDLTVYVGAILITLLAAIGGAILAVRRAVRLAPSEAMRPPAPPRYRSSAAGERLGRILDQPSRMIVRHIGRWPLRSTLTMLGIAASVGLMVSSLHWIDAIEALIENYFFRTARQDVTLTLAEPRGFEVLNAIGELPGVMAVEPFRAVAVRFRHGHLESRESIQGLVPRPALNRALDLEGRPLHLPADGLVMSRTLAEKLSLRPGDQVAVEVLEGPRPRFDVPIAALFDTDLGTPSYMNLRALNRRMLEGPTVSGAYLLTDAAFEVALNRQLKAVPAVASVNMKATGINAFHETVGKNINIMVGFYILFGGLLSFGVVYNSGRIALSERGRELASLRVLGFTRFEIAYILLGELALLTLVALPIGGVLGYLLSVAMTEAFNNELYRIPMVIEASTYGLSMLTTIAATIFTVFLMKYRLDRLDLIAVLKTRE